MIIKILGTGCPNCKTLEKRVRKVVKDNNIEAEINKMKKLASILFALIIALNVTACNNTQSNDNEDKTEVKTNKKIEVYYFHYSHRCQTCVAVEEETIKALNELYPAEMKSGTITFQSIDMDESACQENANFRSNFNFYTR